jgi:chromosome segregation ATPase
VKKLNIQVDNLCHFLPQDRVPDFSRLTPSERLEETERALGSYKLLDLHHQLIKLGQEIIELEQVS